MNFIELEIEAPLSNVRVQKVESVFVSTKTTKGTMSLSKLAMSALGVSLGDLVNVVKAKNGKIYISKGYQDEKVKMGSKLTGQLGRDLSFSSASVYEALGGNENTNRIFDILELDNPDYNIAIKLPNGEQVKAYPVEFKEEINSKPKDGIDWIISKYLGMKIVDLLKIYDRVIWTDSDILIRQDCPNLFDIVPETKLGMFNEGKYAPRADFLQQASIAYNEPLKKWNGKFYNSGVMVI
jgi:hypothetical protein